MKKTLLPCLAIVLLLITQRVVSQIPTNLQNQLQDTLLFLRNNTGIRGLSVSVGYKNLGIWKSAVGEADHGVPLSTEHLIGIGSNTKTFVSVVMLMLMENGEVNLNDTIGNWITGYPNISGQITVRQLLNHTSG